MKKIILTAVTFCIGIICYGQNYLWGTYSYGAITNCSGLSSQYTPVETFVNDNHSLLSGGDYTGNSGCDPGFGGVDIRIVKSNILGEIDYIKKIGTSADDHLVKILDDGHGNNILIGNTISGGISTIFILTLDPNGNITSENTLTQNSTTGAKVLDAEKVGQSPIGFSGSIHLTGVEDDRMFYSELLIGNNNSFFQIHHKTLNQTGTRGKSIEVAPLPGNQVFRVLIVGDRELWTVDPYNSNPTIQKIHMQFPIGWFTTVETIGNEVILGTDAGEVMILDANLTNVTSNKRYGINMGGPGGQGYVNISDIEITSDNDIIASGFMSVYGQDYNTFFQTDMNGSLLNDGHTVLASQSVYENSLGNKFGLDIMDNFCVNYGLRIINPGSFSSLQYEQERLILVSRLDKDFSDNCTWNPLGLIEYNQSPSQTFVSTETSYNSSMSAGSISYQENSNGNYEETVCESSNCSGQAYEFALAQDISSGMAVGAGQIGDPNISSYCDWGFRGPSENLVMQIGFPNLQYFQYSYVLDGMLFTFDITNSSYPFTLPAGVYSFTLFVIDANGCPYFTEYCIPNYGQYEYGRKKAIESIKGSENLSIFPNPSSGNYTFTLNTKEFTQIIVHDLVGKVVKEVNLTNEESQIQLDLTDQPNGIYMVTAIGENNRKSMKISKQ